MIITYAFVRYGYDDQAVIYMLIIQQIDGNIYPRIVGGVMKVHPITIMVLIALK